MGRICELSSSSLRDTPYIRFLYMLGDSHEVMRRIDLVKVTGRDVDMIETATGDEKEGYWDGVHGLRLTLSTRFASAYCTY